MGATVALLAVAAASLPAAAHVDVAPAEGTTVEVGGNATLTVRVPNERDIGTVEVELIFPEAFGSVTVEATPGWTVTAEHDAEPASLDGAVPLVLVHDGEDHGEPAPTGAPTQPPVTPESFGNVSALVWTGGPTGPDETLEFVVTLGPVPDTPTLVFKALQTYEDGEVVRWIQEPAAAGPEPEFPAPVLPVEGATPVADPSADGTGSESWNDAAPSGSSGSDDSDAWKTVLVVVAVVLIVGGITARVVVQRRMHRSLRAGSDDAGPDGRDSGADGGATP